MKIWAVLGMLSLSGCLSTRLSFDPKWDPKRKPQYEDYVDYYVLGFVGHPELNLQKICMDQKPYGLERVRSAEDDIITLITAGIYAPSTVRVWCGD